MPVSERDEDALGGLWCLVSSRSLVERLRRTVGGLEFVLAMTHEKGNAVLYSVATHRDLQIFLTCVGKRLHVKRFLPASAHDVLLNAAITSNLVGCQECQDLRPEA